MGWERLDFLFVVSVPAARRATGIRVVPVLKQYYKNLAIEVPPSPSSHKLVSRSDIKAPQDNYNLTRVYPLLINIIIIIYLIHINFLLIKMYLIKYLTQLITFISFKI